MTAHGNPYYFSNKTVLVSFFYLIIQHSTSKGNHIPKSYDPKLTSNIEEFEGFHGISKPSDIYIIILALGML